MTVTGNIDKSANVSLNKVILFVFQAFFFVYMYLNVTFLCSPSDKPPESIGLVNGETLQQVERPPLSSYM